MSTLKQDILRKIEAHNARVAIIGMGYVGLPLAVAFAEVGFNVVGIDVSQEKVDLLNRGQSYIEDIDSATLRPLVASGKLRASADYAAVADVDAISICVPTPLRKTKDPDISYIISSTESILEHTTGGQLIVLESTTYPGTTEEVILPRIKAKGLTVGEDFFLAFSPERIDPGRTDYTMFTTPKVIGGTTPECLDVAAALYGTVVEQPVPISSTQAAEMVKLLENTFRAVNIGLVNEIAIMCDKLGINVWEVVEAAGTKPYGFMKFTPGPGVGGHCIPIDPHYLSWKLKTLNYNARFIDLAGEINSTMPNYWVGKVQDELNETGKAVKGSHVLVLGTSYKKNVGDVRESPALDILELLRLKGADVQYHDPFVAMIEHAGHDYTCVTDLDEAIDAADCVLIVTDHDMYDWSALRSRMASVVDTRNALAQ